MSLGKEIERKWIVNKEKLPYDLSKYAPLVMEQSYICFSPTVRLRSTNSTSFVLCVKSKPQPGSLARDEFELSLTKEQYENLLTKIEGNIIKKTRYCVPDDYGHIMEFDVYDGALSPLVSMEIEFTDESEALSFSNPPWVEADVTFDHRYKNTYLAKNGLPK